MATVIIAQKFKNTVESLFDQFRLADGQPDTMLLNRTVPLSFNEFAEYMRQPTVPLEAVNGKSYDEFTAEDWDNFTAEEWYGVLGTRRFRPTKASLFLRVAGRPSGPFVLSPSSATVIDAANFATYRPGPYGVARLPEGQMSVMDPDGLTHDDADMATFDYPVRASSPGATTLWVKLRAGIYSLADFDVLIDGEVVASRRGTLSPDPLWMSIPLAFGDTETHTLSLRVITGGAFVYMLVLDPTASTYDAADPDPAASPSPYVTAHVALRFDLPDFGADPSRAYDAVSTLVGLDGDGWRDFRVDDPAFPTDQSDYFIMFSVAGGSASHFVLWETSPATQSLPSLRFDGASWETDAAVNHALRVYSDRVQGTPCCVESRAAQELELRVDAFRESDASLDNCVFRDGDPSPTDAVVIDSSPVAATFVVDQSGSSSWNDRRGQRLDIIERVAARVVAAAAAAGNEPQFSVIAFGGRRGIPVLFSSTTRLPLGDGTSLINDYFRRHADGRSAGVRVVRKIGAYPASPNDGERVADRICSRVRDTGLTAGVDYRYAVYTYDAGQQRFSEPRYVAATPSGDPRPIGVTNVTATVLVGVGARADSLVAAAYPLNEGSGFAAYDYADSNHLRPPPGVRIDWLAVGDAPVGLAAARFDGVSQYLATSVGTAGAVPGDMTLAVWVRWEGGAGTIVSRSAAGSSNFALGVDAGGHLTLKTNGTTATSAATLSAGQWTFVAALRQASGGAVQFRVGADYESAGSLAAGDSSTPMAVTVGAGHGGASKFRGAVCGVSVHRALRNEAYLDAIADASDFRNVDNGDRVVALRWVADPLSAGTAVVVENSLLDPSSPSDGIVVYESACVAGLNEAAVRPAVRAGGKVRYRVFIRSDEGRYSAYEDGSAVEVTLPEIRAEADVPAAAIDAPDGLSAVRSGPYLYLTWQPPEDDDATGVVVFASADGPPVVSSLTNHTGIVVHDGPASAGSARVRLPGGPFDVAAAFVDRFGRLSPAAYAVEQAGGGVPPPPVEALRFETSDEGSLEIVWDNPESFLLDGTAYLGDRAYVYGGLLNEYGDLMSGVPGLRIDAVPTVEVDDLDDPFGVAAAQPEASKLVRVASTVGEDGLARAEVTTSVAETGAALAARVDAEMTLRCEYEDAATGAGFAYASSPMVLSVRHPVSVTVTNPAGEEVRVRERAASGGFAERSYAGCYARRNAPVSLRVNVLYKGTPVAQPSLSALVRRTLEGTGEVSIDGEVDLLPVGADVDVRLATPGQPQSATLFVRATERGAVRTAKFDLRYANPLRVEISPRNVLADGNASGEQTAGVSVVDPNDPELVSAVPALTLVRWTLSGGADVPFFSTDNTRQPNGVYSFVRGGVARKVFLGPITLPPDSIRSVTLQAKVVHDGMVAQDAVPVVFYGADAPDAPPPGARFHSFLDADGLWADGQDYVKLTVVHDVSADSYPGKACFLDCTTQVGATIVSLPPGQPVRVVTPDNFEILWGDVSEHVDGGRRHLEVGEGAKRGSGTAVVDLDPEQPVTEVFLRLNRTALVRHNPDPGYGPCDCYRESPPPADPLACVISLDTSVFQDGASVAARSGGGSRDGIPPLYVTPREPLSIRAVDLRVDDLPSDAFVVDGESVNVLVFEVSWRGEPVPDGTPVRFKVASQGVSLSLAYDLGFTKAVSDPLLNPDGPARSFVSVPVLPVAPTADFTASVTAESNYDESGLTVRAAEAVVSIIYVSDYEPRRASAVISGAVQKLTVGTGVWSLLPELGSPRAGLSLASLGSDLYAVGGSNGRSISQVAERFSGGIWSRIADLSRGRAYAMSFAHGGSLHMLGGVVADGLSDRVSVFSGMESYNPGPGEWTSGGDMPYPAALGHAVVVGSAAFVFGGVSGLDPVTGVVTSVNDRIMRLDLTTGEWTASDPVVDSSLLRVGAAVVADGTTVRVVGGASVSPDGLSPVLRVQPLSFDASGTAQQAADSLAADTAFRAVPSPRYRAASAVVGSTLYVAGGVPGDFPLTDDADAVSKSAGLWSSQSAAPLPLGVHSAGAASDGSAVYVAGGVSGGRGPEFMSLVVEGPARLRADGVGTATVRVAARDRNGNFVPGVPVRVDVSVSSPGYEPTSFELSADSIDNAEHATVVALPRSDDVLPRSDRQAVPVVKGSGEPSEVEIAVDATISHPSYAGRSARPTESDPPVDDGVFASGARVTVRGSRTKNPTDRGVFFSRPAGGIVNFLPPAIPPGTSLRMTLYSDLDWVPEVETLVPPGGNLSDVRGAVAALRSRVPMGCSPLADAVVAACEGATAPVEIEPSRRCVYVLTDGDRNFESVSYGDAVGEAAAMSGSRPVPFVAIDLARQWSPVEDASSASGRDGDLERLASATGGQTLSLVHDDTLDQTVRAAAGGLSGSVGRGTFTYSVDLRERSRLVRLSISATTSANGSVRWRYATSDDGEVFSRWSEPVRHDQSVGFEGPTAKVVRFRVELSSGLTAGNTVADEDAAADPGPSLDAVTVVFYRTLVDEVYLPAVPTDVQPTEVVLTVDAATPPATEVEAGVSTYDGTMWERFSRASEPRGAHRKAVRACRGGQVREPLEPIDAFAARAFYGRWSPDASVSVLDAAGNAVSPAEYRLFPDRGLVVFAGPDSAGKSIEVHEAERVKVGLRLLSRAGERSLVVEGVGAAFVGRSG